MSDATRKVWIVGHKNPDTDTICSAICYANLKNKKYGHYFEAKRAGTINQETAFVLNTFGVEAPELVTDVGTQVQDVDYRRTEGIREDLSLKRAWEIMKAAGVVTLPVLKKKRLAGVITIGDIANANMNVFENDVLSRAETPVRNLVDTLDGQLLVGDEKILFTKGKVLIAAANPDLMENLIAPGDLVILGNRYESQLSAIEMKASVLVVCEGVGVSASIKKLAEENHCCVINTPHDTFTVARLINQSTPVGYFMTRNNLVCFRDSDPVEDIQDTMVKYRHRDFPILDGNGYYLGMLSRRNLLGMRQKQIILVDHNEKSQAADGVDRAEILEIIDHHRLGTISTMSPIFFRNQPVGCTATIIYQMYEEEKVPVDKVTAGLLCSAIISDTLLFRSPTCTELDRQAAKKLAAIAGINLEKYAIGMFTAGSDFGNKTADQIFHQDFKEFAMGDYRVGIGQINSMSREELLSMCDKMKRFMPQAQKKHDCHYAFFMMTAILEEETTLLCVGNGYEQVVEKAFGVKPEGGIAILPGIVSRKKQMVPAITRALQE